jgi:hypothetical protein
LFPNGYQHKGADSDPYLSLYGVSAFAPKAFYAQVLLDPFEE